MPTTLPTLTATRWIAFKGSGRTEPALIGCDLPSGGEVECVVKLAGHSESAPHQPVCELVAALLAVDLGLPVADPLLVEITTDFANCAVPSTNAAARTRCQQSIGWSFATRHLPPGYSILPVGKPPARSLLPILAGNIALLPDAWPGKKTYSSRIESYLKDVRAELASALNAITLSLPPS
jgi:hypothetical protein